MPRKDKFHHIVKNALIRDGWTITDDPYILIVGRRDLYIDLGAESSPIAAEKEGRKILIEIKSFIGISDIHDLYIALGQFVFYRTHLDEQEIEWPLYLAVPQLAYEGIWSEPAGRVILETQQIKLIVYDIDREVIIRWIN